MQQERRHHERNRTLSPVSLLLCFAGLLAIAFSITLRDIQTATLPHQLSILHLTPKIFDKLNSTCEYTLIITLVLSGFIVDLIGPRLVLSIALGVAIIANYLFGHTGSLQTLLTYRLSTEYSHLFILMSVLTLGSHWLPRRHFSFFIGLLFGTLLLVPVAIAAPLTHLITTTGIAATNLPIIIIGVIIILLIIATKPVPDPTRRRTDVYSHLNPLGYYKIWLIGVVAMIGWMTNTFLLGIGAYYLTWKMHFSAAHAMDTIYFSFICFGLGTIVLGILCDLFEKKRNVIVTSYCIAAITFSIVIFAHSLSMTWVALLLYITAFFAGGNIVCYTKANDYCTVENSGITLGLVLSVSTIGSSLFSRMMHYSVQKYIYATPIAHTQNWDPIVAIVPLTLLLGALISMVLLPPTHIVRKAAAPIIDPPAR
jgi:MFS family permease